MGINDLPKPGINFRATIGPGNFQRKLSNATRFGDLKNLRDNREAVVGAVKRYERDIRVKGGLSRLQRLDAWRKVREASKVSRTSITKGDKLEIKQILEHLGRGAAAKAAKLPIGEKGGKFIIIGGKKQYFSPERLKLNSRRTMQRDESALEEGGRRANISVLGKVGGGVKGSAAGRFGLGGQSTGFAQNYKQNKSADSAPPKAPLGGQKPLGF